MKLNIKFARFEFDISMPEWVLTLVVMWLATL
jgi:hypothetical protein